MKTKRFIGFCLGLLFFGATFVFSQSKIIQSFKMRCTSLIINGQQYSQNVREVGVYIFNDNKTVIQFVFHNGTETNYHFTNQRNTGNSNQFESDIDITSGGQRYSGYKSVSSESPGIMVISIYEGRVSAATKFAEFTLHSN